MALIEEVGFDVSYSFIYSARPGTPAAGLKDDTTQADKKARLQRLQTRIREQAAGIARGMIGTTQTVLVMGKSRKDRSSLSL